MRVPESFSCVSEVNIDVYGRLVAERFAEGYEIQNSGMSMGSLGPVWWATFVKYGKEVVR